MSAAAAKTTHLKCLAFRAHHPGWAYAPLSGEGARRHGGRFNAPGTPALYLALDYRTAWIEAQQGFAFKPQPLTICGYDVDCADIADLSDSAGRIAWGADLDDLGCAWEYMMHKGKTPPSWKLAKRLTKRGVAGIVVRSFAPGSVAENRNLILWKWSGKQRPHKITVIDDDMRLPKDQGSWR